MKYSLKNYSICAVSPAELQAANILVNELYKRTGKAYSIVNQATENSIFLVIENESDCENFSIAHCEGSIVIKAHRLRGLIYGCGVLLRKSVIKNGEAFLIQNITCEKSPSMKIRGHQLSYKGMNNSNEAWDEATFRQYITELMFFGTNMIEGVSPASGEPNRLMKYTPKEAAQIQSRLCAELDIDYSMWHPVYKKFTDEDTIKDINDYYGKLAKLNVLFPPGGDPGDLTAADLIERCKKMKKSLSEIFPDLQMWPSAQAPHEYPDWGDRLTEEMAKLPASIDGFIYGPNHPFPLDEMRRSFDMKYPFRFYPDIAHNVRCEVPVRFDREDWHYAWASTLSREAVNPRPLEYRMLHRITRQYFIGSVTYSEGINDDLNKFVWSDMDFDFNCDLRTTVLDYARAFYWETDAEELADAIFGLELNWSSDPVENSSVNSTFNAFIKMKNANSELMKNWRFVMHLFRAQCDKIVRDRRIFELRLIEDAKILVFADKYEEAKKVLSTDFSAEYKSMRAELDDMAQILFDLIGMQLDVERFGGLNWERGCVLETIDNPVTDRKYLLNKINEHPEDMKDIFNRNKVDTDEYYFSFAEHGFEVCGNQQGEYTMDSQGVIYMDFQGDTNREAAIPMCMTKVYDHYSFRTRAAGLISGDYKLRITYKFRNNKDIEHHKISINGNVIYDGAQYGGTLDEAYTAKYLPDGFISVTYDVPAKLIVNGCVELEITEPKAGFMISEFRFEKSSKNA